MKLKKMGSKTGSLKGKSTSAAKPTSPAPTKKGSRVWEGESKPAVLDYSNKSGASSSAIEEEKYATEEIDLDDWKQEEEEEDEEEEITTNTPQKEGRFMSFFKTLSGNKVLEASDLEPVLAGFKQHLTSKNVASDIADKLCESVSLSLQGKKVGSFTSVKTTVRQALEEALVRILTPRRNIDILRDIIEANKQGRPFVMVFVGVNGVGKSTNLAKVCSYLLQNKHSVLFAACDTFRAGAIEQLGIHAKRLGVEIFERGYRNEPSSIAVEAVKYGRLQ
jgi:signal recognition particle receptor subunit alpha